VCLDASFGIAQSECPKGADNTKKGNKSNLYIPFSYAKSQECTLMPEVHKREIVEVGAEIHKNLDHINKLPVKEANAMLPLYQRYLKVAYAHSDESRKRWRTSCYIPHKDDLMILVRDIENMGERDFSNALDEMESQRVRYHPVSDNPEEQASLREQVAKEIKRKKDQRARSAR